MSAFKQPLNALISTPGANGFAYLLDSTRWSASIAGTLQPSASLSSPGADTDWMTLRRCVGSILPVGQPVTAKFYTLAGGAWVHQAALDTTCPAGVSTPVTFYPATYGANDGMIAVQAGATPPTSIGGVATVADISVTQATLDDIPDGTTAKQFNPAAVGAMAGAAITDSTATDVVVSDTVTSGAAVLAGACVGPTPTTMKWAAASAASASSPGICGGVAVAAVGATDLALKVQSTGITGIIADALWDTLPAASDVDKTVYMSKTAGHYTLDVSAYTTTDRVQSLGILYAGGTGACRIELALGRSFTAAQYAALLALPSTSGLANSTNKNLVTDAQASAVAALATNGNLYLASGTVPAFAANAASIAPGTDLACEYVLPSTLTLADASALTVADTGTPPTGMNLHIVCLALSLGHVLTIKDGAGTTIGTIAASLSRAIAVHLQFNGTHFAPNSIDWIGAAA